MDMIFIEELIVITSIGIYDWEQSIRQKLAFNVEIGWDTRKAGYSDNIKDCLNYTDITAAIIHHVESSRFALVERVAEEVSQLLLQRFNAPWVRVKVSKLGSVLHANRVGVTIERSGILS